MRPIGPRPSHGDGSESASSEFSAPAVSGVGSGTDGDAWDGLDPREPEPFREPEPCPACGGSGGSVADGNCDLCSGTGIDPDDPASPL
jgi:DnaJ-class molecular chaperone